MRDGEGGFDVITMVNVVGELADVLGAFKRLRPLVRPDTRLVIVFYNHLWEPLMRPAAALAPEARQSDAELALATTTCAAFSIWPGSRW